ncbi:MAG: hypothetical protein HYT71_02780 [Candidatus Aenigmarchaeota archaeon]|nr:hypothetical protein [Candidatus Aenigmarchaeota archaeon]
MNIRFALLFMMVLLVSGCVQNSYENAAGNVLPDNNTANKQITATTTTLQSSHTDEVEKQKQDLYSSTKHEIEVLYEENLAMGIGPEHYQRLKINLDLLAGSVPDADLIALGKKLEALNSDKKDSGNTQANSPNCVSNASPVFTADVTDTKNIKAITPPRNEKTHSHIWIKDGQKAPVYAPVDAKLVAGAKYTEGGGLNYLLFFDVSCEAEIKFDHITEPVKLISDMFPNPPKIEDTRTDQLVATSFKAGDLIGYTTGTPAAKNWDFGVYNKAKLNHLNGNRDYEEIDWRAGCPYDYFAAGKKEFYYTLFVSKTGEGAPPTDFCKK